MWISLFLDTIVKMKKITVKVMKMWFFSFWGKKALLDHLQPIYQNIWNIELRFQPNFY